MRKWFCAGLVLLALVLVMTACGVQEQRPSEDKDQENPSGDAAPDSGADASRWNEYVNSRFGFSLQFPEDWPEPKESQNGDGAVWMLEKGVQEIRVFGAHYMEGVSKPYENADKLGFTRKTIILNNGEEAALIQGEENGRKIYDVVKVADEIEYHYTAVVTPSYFENNEEILEAMAKSLDVTLEGEDKGPLSNTMALLLPNRKGFRWVYHGFAEYAHEMTLDSVNKDGQDMVYKVTGEVEDLSGGESDRDFSISVTYTAQPNVLVQTKKEEVMMDSNFDRLELVRGLLQKGASWEQEVEGEDGRKVLLQCEITNIEDEDGQKVYTIMYQDKNSDYYEKREIKEGVGVISFEKLQVSEEGNFTMGYQLYGEMSGYTNE